MQRLIQLKRILQTLQDKPELQVPYLREAAELGDYDSIRTLIHAYTYGDYGVQTDPEQAFRYTKMGADLGEGWCQYDTAICCRDGRGCPQDDDQAWYWMAQAAAADVPEAWLPYAQMLIRDRQDYEEARRYILKAISAGQKEDGHRLLGRLCSEKGSALIEEGRHQEAADTLDLGARLDDADCLVTLAYEYSIPDGVGQDMEKTFAFSLKAADLGHPAGMYNVSMCFREGVGTDRDDREAFEWMKNAAKAGFEEAYLPLAQHYHVGLGVHVDEDQALYWVRKAIPCETDPARAAMAGSLFQQLTGSSSEPKDVAQSS